MQSYRYLIVGGGMTADAAIRGIREVDREGAIGLIGSELVPPYDRPPLTKGLWKGESEEEIWRETGELEVELHLGRRAVNADAEQKVIYDDQGDEYGYEKLLLATGGQPRTLPDDDQAVLYYRKFNDYERLKSVLQPESRCLVLGGGFIGSEIAAALAINEHEVEMVFPEIGIGGGIFPPDHARYLNDYFREHAVEVRPEVLVERVEKNNGETRVILDSGDELSADIVIAGLGIEPNVELAEELGLELSDGIHVDQSLRSSNEDVFAAGDVAAFFNPALGERLRVEHEDNANTMGRMAGRSMAGEPVSYDYLPYFYSDLFDQGYEAVGVMDPSLEIVSIWEQPHEKGLMAYMDVADLRGVVLWNLWGRLDAARELIAADRPISEQELRSVLLDTED